MKDFDKLLAELEAQDSTVAWTGPDGMMYRAAEAIRYLRYEANHKKYLADLKGEEE